MRRADTSSRVFSTGTVLSSMVCHTKTGGVREVILGAGSLMPEDVRVVENYVKITGKLKFRVLYVTDAAERTVSSLEGRIPFEEMVCLEQETIGNLAGAQAGSIAFLSNLLREIFSFFSIPVIAKKLNYYTCIAPAGATSEDTTLPMMIRYTDGETVVLSVFNGVICSAAVPFLISFCYNFF